MSAIEPRVPDPTRLPVATTAQRPNPAAYAALRVPSLAAGQSYRDPTTNVLIHKLTSASFPPGGRSWGHFYAEGGDEVSLPHTGPTRTILVFAQDGSRRLIDFTPGVGVSNPRLLTQTTPASDLSLTFSTHPATPQFAYIVADRGTTVRRYDVRGSTPTEVPGDGWPVADTQIHWLHQSAQDGLFTWMRAYTTTFVGYEPATATKKTRVVANGNEPRIDRGGRYICITHNDSGGTIWDFAMDTVAWTFPSSRYLSHQASLRRRWLGFNASATHPSWIARVSPEVPNSYVNIGVPGLGRLNYGSGNWIQPVTNPADQWALFHTYNNGADLVPDGTGSDGWLAPGGMIFIRERGAERRLLAFPYNTLMQGTAYTYSTFAKCSSDGHYVLFTSDMLGSGRSDLFLAEVPLRVTAPPPPPPDTTGPTISNVLATVTGETTATIAWDVSEPATGQVEYGPTPSYGTLGPHETGVNYTTHVQRLIGLTPGTRYHYRVRSQDRAGNLSLSRDFTFTTLGTPPPPAPDNQAVLRAAIDRALADPAVLPSLKAVLEAWKKVLP